MKKSFPKPSKELDIPIYGGKVLYFKTQKQLDKAVHCLDLPAEEFGDQAAGKCIYMEDTNGASLYFVCVFDGLRSTLVHELGHLTFYVLGRAGIDARDSGGEAYCYLHGYLSRELGIDKNPKRAPKNG